MQSPRIKKSNISGLVRTYAEMTEKQIQKEVDELSNMIYALLLTTKSESIEIMFDRNIEITMSMKEIHSTLH
jgi:hypothetical protein